MKRLVVCTLLGCLIVGNSYGLDDLMPYSEEVITTISQSDIKRLEQKIEGVEQKIEGVKQEVTKLADMFTKFIEAQQKKEEGK
ncbi:MAG: hypothetical protein LBG13_01305 [Holosporales bacterium]|jgi:predicted translin family RNA/ssDNA-binding protein|nr:hypothetical protein [Holosporales bacterium]